MLKKSTVQMACAISHYAHWKPLATLSFHGLMVELDSSNLEEEFLNYFTVRFCGCVAVSSINNIAFLG